MQGFIDIIFQKYDSDQNGELTFDEFCTMASVEKPFLNDELCDKVNDLFVLWDTDGNGKFFFFQKKGEIDNNEFRELFKKWDPDMLQGEAYQDLLQAFDNDLNSRYNKEEFKNFIRYMGRDAHYIKGKKRKAYMSEMELITSDVISMLKTMEKNLVEFEFLLGFIKPNHIIMVNIQMNLTQLFTNHTVNFFVVKNGRM